MGLNLNRDCLALTSKILELLKIWKQKLLSSTASCRNMRENWTIIRLSSSKNVESLTTQRPSIKKSSKIWNKNLIDKNKEIKEISYCKSRKLYRSSKKLRKSSTAYKPNSKKKKCLRLYFCKNYSKKQRIKTAMMVLLDSWAKTSNNSSSTT